MPEMKTPQQNQTALTVAFDRDRANLMASLPASMDRERWASVALSFLKTPGLERCSPASVLGALWKNARIGLPLDGVHAALVPFGDECTHIVGYPGWVAIYNRHAGVRNVRAKVVFEGDKFEVEEGSESRIVHVPAPKGNHTDANKVLAAYAVAHLKDGGSTFVVMWRDELDALADRCLKKTKGKGPWATDTIEMFRKSPIIRLRKGLTLTEDVQALLAEAERDEVVIDTEGETVQPRQIATMDDLKNALPEPAAEQVDDNPTPRMVSGLPVSRTLFWENVKDEKFDTGPKLIVGKTPAEVAALLHAGEATMHKQVDALISAALHDYENGIEPKRPYQMLALALEEAVRLRTVDELGARF